MNLNITINLDNAAFQDGYEAARILRDVAIVIERRGKCENINHDDMLLLWDANGNKVGKAIIVTE